MRGYTVYVNGVDIGVIDGVEAAYEAYAKSIELADMFCGSAMLVYNGTGEVVAYHGWDEDD